MSELITNHPQLCPCCGREKPPLPLREPEETSDECRRRMEEDPCSPLVEYGEEWPAFKALEQALNLKSYFWWVAGNEEKSAAAQRELWEFWESPRPLSFRSQRVNE